ncbi:hypothetical protein ACN26Y_03545 [Micromonospora sp. WMMD558]|uniref:hypothetical protein n=1 Tax=Micromonospora sp. WMMD558 TaxID=3403462 RepID=UPI003BF4F623
MFGAEGGHGVLAANGRDGFAFRHPDGRWERVGSLHVDWENDTAEWAARLADPARPHAADPSHPAGQA